MFCKAFERGLLAAVVVLLTAMAANAGSDKISGASAFGWPNGRISNHFPTEAVDGDTDSFTYTTEAFNQLAGRLGLDFGREVSIDRIRLYKDNYGGGDPSDSPAIKNLEILYTTDSTDIPLASRSFVRVTDLVNGFQGTEMMIADSVNADGTVSGDVHYSPTNGWASLSFSPVAVTGVAIGFYYPGTYQHYKVHEFEAYMDTAPEPSTLVLLGIAAASLLAYSWRRPLRTV
jgi:hypothetical protein